MTHLLVAVLALSIGWCLGHRTARIRHVPIGATAETDQAAFLAEERRRFDELVAGLDLQIPGRRSALAANRLSLPCSAGASFPPPAEAGGIHEGRT